MNKLENNIIQEEIIIIKSHVKCVNNIKYILIQNIANACFEGILYNSRMLFQPG